MIKLSNGFRRVVRLKFNIPQPISTIRYLKGSQLMIITFVSVILFVILVAVTFAGGRLARVIHAEQLSAESNDAMIQALGLVDMLTAYILMLLICSDKG